MLTLCDGIQELQMQTFKVIALGILFSFAGFLMLLFISIIRGKVRFETAHATGLSAMAGGIIEGLFNPITWLVIVAAFGAAFLLVRRTA
jgi:hypothetical protein